VKRKAPASPVTFDDALGQLESVVRGDARAELLDALMSAGGADAALARLRKAMRSHAFPGSAGTVKLRRIVDTLDARTRREGMHVLQGWDFVAHRFPKDIAPVLLLDYCARLGIPANREREALAILVDQYFLAILSLFAVRAWDEGDANENLDRITAALDDLQGPHGSAHPIVADAETLLMLAVSYYHPEERGYDLLVQRVAALDAAHQLRFARPCAALLGAHLRWGLRFMYERDVGRMRADNVADYPLLTFAVLTLARAHDRLLHAGITGPVPDLVAEALLQALSPDPWAFVDNIAPALSSHADWHAEVRRLLAQNRDRLLTQFERHQPSPKAFSPLGFACNFPMNATVAMAALAVQDTIPRVPLNSLFTSEAGTAAERLAQQLMAFAASDPNRLGAGGSPLLVYDPFDGAHHFNKTLRTLRTATWT
jgi:hypothetical protein